MKWMERAFSELGVSEVKGRLHNPRIVEYFKLAGHAEVSDDETAWCAAFACAILEQSGVRSTRSLRARSFATWGVECQPKEGAIVVLQRGNDRTLGHVGFCVSVTADTVTVLGGNQSDKVCVADFPRDRVIAWRWPDVEPDTEHPALSPTDAAVPVSVRSTPEVLAQSRTVRGALYAGAGSVVAVNENIGHAIKAGAERAAELGPVRTVLETMGANTKAIGMALLVWGIVVVVLRRIADEKDRRT